MVKENHTYQIISTILLIAMIVFAALYFTKSAPTPKEINEQTCSEFINECPKIPEEKALITPYTLEWFVNTYNQDEILYDVVVYNYGYKDAKNVLVNCELYRTDEEGNFLSTIPLKFVSKNFGTIRATSYKNEYVSQLGGRSLNDDWYFIPVCEVKSCEDCEILDERIPEFR